MPPIPVLLRLPVLVALGTLPAQAQPPAPASALPAAPLDHRSAFDGYRPFSAPEVQPWRQSNDTVRDIGGWRAYAREISGTAVPGTGQSAQPAPPSHPADPHAGHAKP